MPVSWGSPGVHLLPRCGGRLAGVFQFNDDMRVHPADVHHLTEPATKRRGTGNDITSLFSVISGDAVVLRLAGGHVAALSHSGSRQSEL